MKTRIFLNTLICCAAFWIAVSGTASRARAVTLTLTSGTDTLAAALGVAGTSTSAQLTRLDTADTSGLTFSAALVGGLGSGTGVPSGAPVGTQVINIAPGDGENGYFMVTFSLPAGFSGASLAGAANIDDVGRAFLNGNAISASLTDNANVLDQYDNRMFSTTNASFFQSGLNTLLISDANKFGGPSAAAFYATINYAVPEPSSWVPVALGAALFGGAFHVRRQAGTAR